MNLDVYYNSENYDFHKLYRMEPKKALILYSALANRAREGGRNEKVDV
jgi:hypothetical protein